ncbi:methylmalonyl-CoA epimerase, mitochondrial-like isoform X2 [Apostichopus japonicus]|uniref:methylmalonyl-CoA epimerase, mitochondrial-like isoform X2 n=1 Tax=Stichopus japonicus TaxID=307972 RepID=UPI003AB1BBE7
MLPSRDAIFLQGSKVIAACQRTVSSERKAPWNLGKLNHVAIAVPNLEKATDMYKNVLGAKVSEPMPLPEHGVRVVFIELGNTKLELLHPLGENSPIEGFLKKQPDGGMHHICIEVDDIKEAIKTMQANKVRPLNPEPKIGAHGKPVTFLHPKDCGGVLIELEEA